MSAAPQRILLLQLHHLGDVLLTTPAIRAARAAFPSATLDYVTSPGGAHALERNPHLNSILVNPGLVEIFRPRYDAVVDMHSVPRTAKLVAATRATMRVGLRGRGPRNFAYNRLLPREPNAVYMALQKLRLLAPLGVEEAGADLSIEIAVHEEEQNFAAQILERYHLGERPLVAISPVARHDFKQWGAANWAVVADAIVDAGAQVLITSGPGEEAQAAAVALLMKHEAVWQYGPTTVRQLAAVYQRCILWLGNDGGPKHIAVAAKTPTVTVYRRNLGAVWSDPDDANQIAINSGVESLDTISPAQVIEAAHQLMSRLPA